MQRCVSLDETSHFVGLILYDVVYGILNQPRLDVSAAICTETLRDLWMVYEWKLADLRKQAAAKYVSYETLALLSSKLCQSVVRPIGTRSCWSTIKSTLAQRVAR